MFFLFMVMLKWEIGSEPLFIQTETYWLLFINHDLHNNEQHSDTISIIGTPVSTQNLYHLMRVKKDVTTGQ